MLLLIVGTLEGQIGAASQIAIQRGAKVQQADTPEGALDILRRSGADLVMIEDAGHSALEPGVRAALVRATEVMARPALALAGGQ